jgi:hypothetical protein
MACQGYAGTNPLLGFSESGSVKESPKLRASTIPLRYASASRLSWNPPALRYLNAWSSGAVGG